MYEYQRLKIILEELSIRKSMTLPEIQELLGVSMTTVRRDIKILVDSQQVNKVYGGIAVLEHKPGALCKQRALPLSVPAPEAGEKLDIARTAATIIKDGDAIYLDSSPIIETMIPFLQARDLTVVTPSLANMEKLFEKRISFIILDGIISDEQGTIIYSDESIIKLENMGFDAIFLGTSGIDLVGGYTATSLYDSKIRALMLKKSADKYILAETSSFNKIFLKKFGECTMAKIVTRFDADLCQGYKDFIL